MTLTAKKRAFADAVLAGRSNKDAAIVAGYSPATASAAGSRLVKDPVVAEINRIYITRLEAALCHLMAIGQRNGELEAQRPALEMARAFLASYYGLRILGRALPERAYLNDVIEGLMARL